MALLLAPYNDSMRLGMGFNSYTQTLCIDGAVHVSKRNILEKHSPSQVVTYSSKFVERLSDIVSTMNISYSSAIKKGTIEVAGNGNSIDEDKIKASDVNLVVSVQVINQTTIVEDSAEFKEIEGVLPGTQTFNDAFGDCYISGFITGGDFSSIISMRSLDRSKTSSVVKSIKKMTKTKEAETFSMDNYSFNDSLSNSEALKDTETTVSVNWMGGGDIKDPKTQWDVESVYAAAAAFPSNVAKTPQRTWAILTKYKANRSFNKWAIQNSLKPLEYDAVLSYTAELFNNFMEYKQLVKRVQDIIAHHGDYQAQSGKENAIPPTISTLVAVRAALRNEMNKIVAVVNVLSRDPGSLQQSNSMSVVSKDAIVRQIMQEAISGSPEPKKLLRPTEPAPKATSGPASISSNESADSFDIIKTPGTEEPPAAPKTTVPPKGDAPAPIDLSQLIAPEIWSDLLPTRINTVPVEDSTDGTLAAAATMFPPPPKDDSNHLPPTFTPNRLHIHRAVYGIHDVTHAIQSRVVDGKTFSIGTDEIDGLGRVYDYERFPQPFMKNLSIVYQYGEGPLRLVQKNYVKERPGTISINESSEHPRLTPRPWNKETWSLLGVVYDGEAITDADELKLMEDAIRDWYFRTSMKNRALFFDEESTGRDLSSSQPGTGVVFYRVDPGDKGPIFAAVGIILGKKGMSCAAVLNPNHRLAGYTYLEQQTGRESITFPQKRVQFTAGDEPLVIFPNGRSIKLLLNGHLEWFDADGSSRGQYPAAELDPFKVGVVPQVVMESDGKLLCRAGDQTLWEMDTGGRGVDRLEFGDRGNWLKAYASEGTYSVTY